MKNVSQYYKKLLFIQINVNPYANNEYQNPNDNKKRYPSLGTIRFNISVLVVNYQNAMINLTFDRCF